MSYAAHLAKRFNDYTKKSIIYDVKCVRECIYDGNNWIMALKKDVIDKLYDSKRDYIEENIIIY